MQSADYARHMFAYDTWANRLTLDSLATMAAPSPRAIKLMAHIPGAQQIWLDRIHSVPQSLAVWPDWPVEQLRAHLERVQAQLKGFLATLTDTQLAHQVPYTNTKGEKFASRVGDILTHTSFHGVYHRGQIAAEVRAHGGTPAYTDYIQAVRSGALTR